LSIRIAATTHAAEDLVRRATAAYHGLTIPGETKIRYQTPRRLESWLQSALLRQPDRATDFYLTAAEAANLYHTPLRPRALPQLESVSSTRLPIPGHLATDGLLVGFGAYRGARPPIRIAAPDRLRHTYLIGQTGTGKSTLFQAAALQDMEAGEGVCFIDPHGEVIDWLLPRIPAHRAQDVILFDPSDPEALLGLNLLEWRTPHERDLLIQELILLFYKLFDPGHTGIIGPQFEHWLRNAALTVTEPKIRGTLVDIPRLFTDKPFNQAALARLNEVAERNPPKDDALQRLRIEYEDHIRQVEGAEPESAGTPLRLFSSEYERLSHEALQVERMIILKLRNQDVINDEVLRRIQQDIDLAQARLQHHQ